MQSHSNENGNEKHQVGIFNPAEVSQFLHNPNFNDLNDNDGDPDNSHESDDDELARSIKQRFELTHAANNDPNDNGARRIDLDDSSFNESNGEGETSQMGTTDGTYSNFIHSVYNQRGSQEHGLVISFV